MVFIIWSVLYIPNSTTYYLSFFDYSFDPIQDSNSSEMQDAPRRDKIVNTDIMVTVVCMAYNHEKYIAQCIDGFLMQQVDFNFEILIHDDASTDKTASIIRDYEKKYPIIEAIYQETNQYSRGGG